MKKTNEDLMIFIAVGLVLFGGALYLIHQWNLNLDPESSLDPEKSRIEVGEDVRVEIPIPNSEKFLFGLPLGGSTYEVNYGHKDIKPGKYEIHICYSSYQKIGSYSYRRETKRPAKCTANFKKNHHYRVIALLDFGYKDIRVSFIVKDLTLERNFPAFEKFMKENPTIFTPPC